MASRASERPRQSWPRQKPPPRPWAGRCGPSARLPSRSTAPGQQPTVTPPLRATADQQPESAVVSVISGVHSLAAVLGADADLLEAAVWLHDIGYTADLAITGLQALDCARYLRDAQHAGAMLCRLVE